MVILHWDKEIMWRRVLCSAYGLSMCLSVCLLISGIFTKFVCGRMLMVILHWDRGNHVTSGSK